jgi:hypothetical protein
MLSHEKIAEECDATVAQLKNKCRVQKNTWLYGERACLENRPLVEIRKRARVQKILHKKGDNRLWLSPFRI